MAEGADDEVDCYVGDGFGAGGGGVAVHDASFGQSFDVDPVEACGGGGVDFAGGRQQVARDSQ